VEVLAEAEGARVVAGMRAEEVEMSDAVVVGWAEVAVEGVGVD
jgi:hypothetical protein